MLYPTILLLNKNFKIQFRHPIVTFFEVITPCLLVLIVESIRTRVSVTVHNSPTIYDEFDLLEIPKILSNDHSDYVILYSPKTNTTNRIVNELIKDMDKKCFLPLFELEIPCFTKSISKAIGFNTNEDMVDFYLRSQEFVLCGIEFGQLNDENIEFTLRFSNIPRISVSQSRFRIQNWKTNMIMKEVMPSGPREKNATDGGNPGYGQEGFLYIQHRLSLVIARVLYDAKMTMPEIELKARRFPYPKYIEDPFLFTLNFLFPTIFMFSFFFPSINLTKVIVNEKEKQIKESMKMMGLKEKYHCIAHFIKAVLFTFPSIILIIIVLKIQFAIDSPPILITDAIILFFYFFLYEICNICFCFMISTFFSKANLAGIVTGLLFFLSYIPYYSLIKQYNYFSSLTKILHCFLPNTNMSLGVFLILMRETRGVAVTWNNVAEPSIPNDSLTLLVILLMYLVNSSIYMLVTWYMTLAFPGQYGVPLPWNFPFTKQYWFRTNTFNDDVDHRNANANRTSIDTIEAYPPNFPIGVSIQSLSKTYDNGKTHSVENLSLDIFENQITVLLGHNGAGKTTTLLLLCGLISPSSGTAIVNGFDIRFGMNQIRSSLGICPQTNLLFDELTVEEHLEFYCKLKHTKLTAEEIKKEVKTMVKKLDLVDMFQVSADKLSGGMKRKLSVGIALIGDPKVVILDEPTSGMDISARRFIWDLLMQEKKGRTIIISTHFMDEADILGDRIAIMDNGRLQCYGSPLFLKNRFGGGYHLRMEKRTSDIKTDAIDRIVHEYVPNAKLESSVGTEIMYSLSSNQISFFEVLLSRIETELSDQIINYGISITTMEEVFLKVGSHNQKKIESMIPKHYNNEIDDDLNESEFKEKNTGIALIIQQFYGLLVKKLIYSFRNPFLMLAQLLLPLIILISTILMIRSIPQLTNYKKLELSLNQFRKPLVKYFVPENNLALSLAKVFGNILKKELGEHRVTEIHKADDSSVMKEILSVDNYVYNYEFFTSAIFSYANDSNFELKVVAMFNNQPFHTPAISLKYVDQALIRYFYGKTNLKLTVSNYPMPMTINEKLLASKIPMGTPGQFQIIQSIIMGISFFVSSFSIMIVTERVVKSKHLQKICGLRMSLYWSSLFIVDYLIYLITITLIILTLHLFQVKNLYEDQQSLHLFIGYSLCGFALIPFVYVASFMFTIPSTAYARLSILLVLTGIISMITDQLTSIKEIDLLHVNRVLKVLFQLFIPLFDISKITNDIQANLRNNKVCHWEFEGTSIQEMCHWFNYLPLTLQNIIRPCCKDHCNDNCLNFEENYYSFKEPGIGLSLLYVTANMIIYWILLTIIESNEYLKRIIELLNQKFSIDSNEVLQTSKTGPIDEDVQKEKMFVENIVSMDSFSDYPLVIKNLVKKYGKLTAVNDVSYRVNRGECFGLLGVNGAGKTSTFRMITCNETIDSGNIFVNGYNAAKEQYRTLERIGYCPQFDMLFDELTGAETLKLYSRLRGIKENEIQQQIEKLSQMLYFEMYLNKETYKYSGGNKRKLSVAIALLGNLAISFLDEPTSGVDPLARRCLWQVIGKKLKQNISIVLTSHSMEECETLCHRLIIMVNGQIRCIGSPLHLKKKFGNSYNLILKVSQTKQLNEGIEKQQPSFISSKETSFIQINQDYQEEIIRIELEQRIGKIKNFISKTFPTSCLKSIHNNILDYIIQNKGNYVIRCSEIFGVIEKNKESLLIEDYSVSQMNLEQIFLSFVRNQ